MKPKRKKSQRQMDIMDKFKRELKLRPLVSDKEFMAETEVSEAEYKKGIILPGTRK